MSKVPKVEIVGEVPVSGVFHQPEQDGTYQFMRRQPDGGLVSIRSTGSVSEFDTIEEAKKFAPTILSGLRQGKGQIVLVKIVEAVQFTADVRYEKWSQGTRKKLGLK